MKFTISLQPITKKNHQNIITNKRTGRAMVIPSPQYLQYEKDCGVYLYQYFGLKIKVPVNIKALYYVEDRRIRDLVGLHQALQDILAHYEVIKDDNSRIIAGLDGSRVLYDKKNPRTEVTITRIKD